MLVQLYAIIWSRNGVGLTCMSPYRHADAVDSVRLTCEGIRMQSHTGIALYTTALRVSDMPAIASKVSALSICLNG